MSIKLDAEIFDLLTLCHYVNSIGFLVCFTTFIFLLKYDLHSIRMSLQIFPELEFFIDLESDENERFIFNANSK
jgi:hypothetical protein